jgi:protein-tyrosine phosphatase
MNILVLCTANLCRSPMAAALLERHLAAAGVDATVHSAGRLAEGYDPPPEVMQTLAALGLDVSDHRSRIATATMVGEADLVIAMAKEHARDAVALDPDVLPRTFTLKELVRLGEAAGPRHDGEDLSVWLARIGAGRSATALLGSARADDIGDPMGGPARGYRRAADELDTLTRRLAGFLV